MIEQEIIPLISQFGFPIVMVIWFMFRMEKILNKQIESFDKLALAVTKCPYSNTL